MDLSGRHRAFRGHISFPPRPMLYTIKLTYQIVVDAASQSSAHKMACKKMKESPELFISRVEMGGGSHPPKPLWQRLVFGN